MKTLVNFIKNKSINEQQFINKRLNSIAMASWPGTKGIAFINLIDNEPLEIGDVRIVCEHLGIKYTDEGYKDCQDPVACYSIQNDEFEWMNVSDLKELL